MSDRGDFTVLVAVLLVLLLISIVGGNADHKQQEQIRDLQRRVGQLESERR